MSNTNLFFTAAKSQYRFTSNKGQLSVEDLFSLSLTALDAIAVGIDEEIQKLGRKSFISKTTNQNTDLSNKLEIVKLIIQDKQDEAENRKARAEKAGQKAFLEGLLQKKKIEKLEGLSEEDIQKQLDALN